MNGTVANKNASSGKFEPRRSFSDCPPRAKMQTPGLKPCLSLPDPGTSLEMEGTSDLSTPRLSNSKIKKQVSFHKIKIREYERILGDNPSVTSGPPISIGWGYVEEDFIRSVNEYEGCRPRRRTKSELIIPSFVRRGLLEEEFGVSKESIKAASKEVKGVQKKRHMTRILPEGIENAQEMLQATTRKFSNIFGKRKEEKEKLWHAARVSTAQR
mmetsp:Transcript_31204/g.47798  ORF Transcript_31204/g.47798 Transcript_31204/m.47798 type:complete len:213 (-) Transcript_31204:2018-2656(-)